MHELPVTENILAIALRHAESAGARRITALYLTIGQLSSIVDDSIQFYWDIISEGTPAQGAQLHFKRIPARLACLDCGQEYAPDGRELACPACQSLRIKVVAGEEFLLESIEVE
jgi:hydrogenase nickel incorporation protein HypA/HybF